MWIILALLSALSYASATMVAKYSVSRVIRDQKGIVILHAVSAFIMIGILWVFDGMPLLHSHQDIGLALLSGSLIGVASVFYFKAFHLEDASTVTLLTQAIVPLTLVFGYIVLHDQVGPYQLVAAGIIMSGVVITVWSRKGFHIDHKGSIPIMAAATVVTTIVLLISKSVLRHNGTIAYTLYQTFGYAVFGIVLTVLHPSTRRGFTVNMRPLHTKMLLVIGFAELLYMIALIAQFKAFTYTNAGLVISVGASEVFISILLGITLTKLLPHMIHEKIDKKTIGRKFVAGCLIISGIVLLNFVH